MSRKVVIIGAGMGGLTAALRLRDKASTSAWSIRRSRRRGGVWSGGFRFDAGPYLLLDRPGLSWAFHAGLDLAERVPMRRVEDVYQVEAADGSVSIHADLKKTAAGIEQTWPGGGLRYREFVESISIVHKPPASPADVALPSPATLIRTGAWRGLPFLLRPLGSVLAAPGSPRGGRRRGHLDPRGRSDDRRSPQPAGLRRVRLARRRAYYPEGGLDAVPTALEAAAVEAGVEFLYGTTVTAIRRENGRARGVETARARPWTPTPSSPTATASAPTWSSHRRRARAATPARKPRSSRPASVPTWPSAVIPAPPYLRFRSREGGDSLVTPAAICPPPPARRLVAGPSDGADAYAERSGSARPGSATISSRILAEPWWREHVGEARVLDARTRRTGGGVRTSTARA